MNKDYLLKQAAWIIQNKSKYILWVPIIALGAGFLLRAILHKLS